MSRHIFQIKNNNKKGFDKAILSEELRLGGNCPVVDAPYVPKQPKMRLTIVHKFWTVKRGEVDRWSVCHQQDYLSSL